MTSIVDKVKHRLNSRKDENGNVEKGKLSRTSSLRSTLSRTLSRKDKKKPGPGEDDKKRYKKGNRDRFSFENASRESLVSSLAASKRVPSYNSSVNSKAATRVDVAENEGGQGTGGVKIGGESESEELGKKELPKRNLESGAVTLTEIGGTDKKSGEQGKVGEPGKLEEPSQMPDVQDKTLSDSNAAGKSPTEESGAEGIVPELIQASSTPIQENTAFDPTSPQSVRIENDTEAEAGNENEVENEILGPVDETAPLLAASDNATYTNFSQNFPRDLERNQARERRGFGQNLYDFLFRENAWTTFFVTFLLVVIAVTAYSTFTNIGSLLDQAVRPDIQSVSVLDITDDGVSVHVIGSVFVEYEEIANYFYRNVLKLAGLLLGGVTVVPQNGCKIFLSGDQFPQAHVLDVFPPEQSVDLVDRRITEIDFISEAQLVQENLADLTRALLSVDTLVPLELDVEILTSPKVKARWFHFASGEISIAHHILVQASEMRLPLRVDDLNVEMSNRSVALDISASSTRELPLQFELDSVEWDAALPDCSGESTILGEWVSDPLKLEPNERCSVSVHGKVEKVPDALLETCADGVSPFNKFTNELISDNILKVSLRAKQSRKNKNKLPSWLYNVISLTFFPIEAPVPTSQTSYLDLIANYTLANISLIVPESSAGVSTLLTRIGADIVLDIDLPFRASNVAASVSDILATFTALDEKEKLLEVRSNGQDSVEFLSSDSLSGVLTSHSRDAQVEVLSPLKVGKLINEFFKKFKLNIPVWEFILQQGDLHLPILDTQLRNLHFQHRSEPMYMNEDEGFFDRLLRMMDVHIDRVFYVDLNKTHVELVIDLKITNPLDVLLLVPNDTLAFGYLYNNTDIGTVFFENVEIPANAENLELSLAMNLACETNEQRVFAEEFVSKVISANEGTQLGVRGKSLSNPALTALLAEIELDNLKFPVLHFENDKEEDGGEDDEKLRRSETSVSPRSLQNSLSVLEDEAPLSKSPFLIDATIHVLTSEIELTIYNPVSNAELMAEIIKCQATYKGNTLANIEKSELMLIPPGIYKTPRIPIKVSQGIGSDILRKAMNGKLFVEVTASLGVRIDKFSMQLLYHGKGLTATVKL